MNNYDNIISILKETQKPSRFTHTMGVAYTSCSLAMCYGEDIEKAFLSGLLHDCSKTTDADYLAMAAEYDVEIPEYAFKKPGTLHAPLSAEIAKDKFKIEDEAVLMAITSHNFGRPGMSMLEKILYIADYIEPSRNFDLEKLTFYRNLAFKDLDKCLVLILKDTIDFVEKNGYPLVPITLDTYSYYKNGEIND